MVDTNRRVQLGKTGPSVFPIALGCMGMGRGSPYGDGAEAESVATVHAAIDRGVTLLDTGDFYGMGSSEMLVGQAIKDRRDKVQLSVKFGGMRGPDGSWFGYDARPAAVKNFAAYSLERLGVDVIDVYRPARLDPLVPILYWDTAVSWRDPVLQLLRSVVGIDRVLFGTDFPYLRRDLAIGCRAQLGRTEALTDEERGAVLGETALALFPRIASRVRARASSATRDR